MITAVYNQNTYNQYKIKSLERQLESFKNETRYQKMKIGFNRMQKYYENKLRDKDRIIEKLNRTLVSVRNQWFEVYEDIQEENRKALHQKCREIEDLKAKLQDLKQKNSSLKKELSKKTREVVDERSKAIDQEEKNRELHRQISENFTNSSIPSSRTEFRGKVFNNRETTDKKPGGQPGHEGHRRKKHEINGDKIFIEAPSFITNNPDYYEQSGSGSEVHKQRIRIIVSVIVDDFCAKIYRNKKTGAKYHAPFPSNIHNEVNYGESVKAMIFLMKNHLNVSEEKIREFLSVLTDGELSPSRGMINQINAELSAKTQSERSEMFAKLVCADVLYSDMTGARMNGSLKNVVICTDKDNTMYFFRDKKGDEGFKGTPVEFMQGTHVHDHDKTTYHYGTSHQECNEHHLRYLKGAMEMEPELTWHGKMRELLQEMNKIREKQDRILSEDQIAEFEKRYDEIVELSKKEYRDYPPSPYYRKGYNLSKEFNEYRESILYFLRHPNVDFTNNVSERAARKIGRHMAVSGTFRGKISNHSAEEYCNAMSILEKARNSNKNTYQHFEEIFARDCRKKKRSESV